MSGWLGWSGGSEVHEVHATSQRHVDQPRRCGDERRSCWRRDLRTCLRSFGARLGCRKGVSDGRQLVSRAARRRCRCGARSRRTRSSSSRSPYGRERIPYGEREEEGNRLRFQRMRAELNPPALAESERNLTRTFDALGLAAERPLQAGVRNRPVVTLGRCLLSTQSRE